jgi:hypothetical protein
MEQRICTVCKQSKDLVEFYQNITHKNHWCKSCSSIYRKKYYLKNRKSIKEKQNKYFLENKKIINKNRRINRENNPGQYLLQHAKSRAKRKGLLFNLTRKDIVVPSVCPVLGIPLQVGTKIHYDASPTIDRIDNSKGYTKDNIVIVSWRANSIKKDASIDELKRLVDFYSKF